MDPLPNPEQHEVLRHLAEFKQMKNLKDQMTDDHIRSILDKLLSIIQALELQESRLVTRLDDYKQELVGGQNRQGELHHGHIKDLRHVKYMISYMDTAEDILLDHDQVIGSFYTAINDILKVIKNEPAKNN